MIMPQGHGNYDGNKIIIALQHIQYIQHNTAIKNDVLTWMSFIFLHEQI